MTTNLRHFGLGDRLHNAEQAAEERLEGGNGWAKVHGHRLLHAGVMDPLHHLMPVPEGLADAERLEKSELTKHIVHRRKSACHADE